MLPPLRGLGPDWISDPKVWRTEVLAGLVVAPALIPEANSFSIIAGVDPAVGLSVRDIGQLLGTAGGPACRS